MPLNLCSVSISPSSPHVEGVQSWDNPDLQFTSIEGREAAYKRFRASPPDTPPVILPRSSSLYIYMFCSKRVRCIDHVLGRRYGCRRFPPQGCRSRERCWG